MKEYLQKLPGGFQDLIHLCAEIAAENHYRVFLVGGFVRDLILGVKNLDLDIVVEGDGIKYAEDLSCRIAAKLIRHRRFGTATVELTHSLKMDIATARVECYPEPGCLPSVTAGSIKDDLKRRDFSINAMAISINKLDYGELIDFFEGKNDLRKKRIRVLHSLSFIDDPTRILRAIRFEKRFGFSMEKGTLLLLKDACGRKMLERVQPHRLRDELILILKEDFPVKQIKRIKKLIGFNFISRRFCVTASTFKLLTSMHTEINRFKKNYPHRRQLETWLIYFLGMIDSLSLRDVKALCQSYAFRNGDSKRMFSFKGISAKFVRRLNRDKAKPSEIFDMLEDLSYEVIITIKAKHKNALVQRNIKDFLEIYNGMRICISGDDLRRLGIPAGSYYKKIFSLVLKAKLNGAVKTKEDELSLIRKWKNITISI